MGIKIEVVIMTDLKKSLIFMIMILQESIDGKLWKSYLICINRSILGLDLRPHNGDLWFFSQFLYLNKFMDLESLEWN